MPFGRGNGATEANGPYEVWVTTLHAWSRHPETPLDLLPALTVDTFDHDTHLRLMKHITAAMEEFMRAWSARLDLALRARTPHEFGVELVAVRRMLQRRQVLATHPSLPEPVRQAYTDAFALDVRDLQTQLEQAVRHDAGRGRIDTAMIDRFAAEVRRNPLTALLASAPAGAPAPAAPAPAGRRRLLAP